MNDPFERKDDSFRYGAYVSMGQLDKEFFIAHIASTAKMLLDQMFESVTPTDDITLIFKLNKTNDDDIFSCTGAWKCFGRSKHERKTGSESSSGED